VPISATLAEPAVIAYYTCLNFKLLNLASLKLFATANLSLAIYIRRS
jgi:hypothetical protein